MKRSRRNGRKKDERGKEGRGKEGRGIERGKESRKEKETRKKEEEEKEEKKGKSKMNRMDARAHIKNLFLRTARPKISQFQSLKIRRSPILMGKKNC